MPTFLYWRHKMTGDIYAVHVTDDGLLDGAIGPIPPNEATIAKLPEWKFIPLEGKRIRGRLLEFERIEAKQ
ncbi:MAG: hypothetical protein AB7P69_11060 [Candidatus Binatia bacterium]